MLESVPVIIAVGTVLGLLAGLGVGGGSVLILWLTLVLHMPQETARGINLLFFLPAAIISCFLRWHQKTLSIKKIWPAMVAGAVSACGFTWLSDQIPTELLRIPFGILLLLTGAKELFYRPQKER